MKQINSRIMMSQNSSKINNIRSSINNLEVTGRHPLYKAVMYWSKKPPEYIELIINHLTNKNNIVLDPFVGSGSAVLQAIDQERKAIGVDINEWPLEIIRNLGKNINYDEFDNEYLQLIDDIKKNTKKYYTTHCNKCGSDHGFMEKIIFDKKEKNHLVGNIYYYCSVCRTSLNRKLKSNDIKGMNTLIKEAKLGGELIENSRTAVKNELKISDLFTPRNLSVCTIIKNVIETKNLKHKNTFLFLFGSMLHLAKLTDKKSQSQFPFWLPDTGLLERNVISLFEKKYRIFRQTAIHRPKYFNEAHSFKELDSNDKNILLINKPMQKLNEIDIPNNSVDLVITDPPYFDQVPYSEYMLFWQYWLNNKVGLKDEIVVSNCESRKKTKDKYIKEMQIVFQVINKKLKRNKWLCLFFHDSNLNNWSSVFDCVVKNGFVYKAVFHLPKKRASYKNITTPLKSLKGDAIILFRKSQRKGESHKNNDVSKIEKRLMEKLSEYLRYSKKELSTAEIYDNVLLPELLEHNTLKQFSQSRRDFISIIEKVCIYKDKTGIWALKNERE